VQILVQVGSPIPDIYWLLPIWRPRNLGAKFMGGSS